MHSFFESENQVNAIANYEDLQIMFPIKHYTRTSQTWFFFKIPDVCIPVSSTGDDTIAIGGPVDTGNSL